MVSAKGDFEAIEGMAFALDYAATSLRRHCAGYRYLGRRPLKHRDCIECGGCDDGLCVGYQAVVAVEKWRQSAALEAFGRSDR